MKIGMYGRVLKEQHKELLELWISAFNSDCDFFIEQKFFEAIKDKIAIPDGIKTYQALQDIDIDYLVSFGGDGTFLDSIENVGDRQLPIMGINTGRMGFLASVDKDDIDRTIKRLQNKEYEIEERMLLHLKSENNYFGDSPFALNEFTIHKKDTSSMITIHTYNENRFLNSYWVDGLIVSTPTGSTGYSLSCGGPIISPQTNNIVITPVAPHNLNVRPIIISDNAQLSFEVEGRENEFLCSLDSRSETFRINERLKLCKADFRAQLIRFEDYDFMETLRTKLGWGSDTRKGL